jgi:hypothetical protein
VPEVLDTAALKATVCEGPRVTLPGVTDTLTGGVNEMVALDAFVVSATLVAATFTVCAVVIDAGAV